MARNMYFWCRCFWVCWQVLLLAGAVVGRCCCWLGALTEWIHCLGYSSPPVLHKGQVHSRSLLMKALLAGAVILLRGCIRACVRACLLARVWRVAEEQRRNAMRCAELLMVLLVKTRLGSGEELLKYEKDNLLGHHSQGKTFRLLLLLLLAVCSLHNAKPCQK
ncbi:hypothetical protein GQ54DRAFT_22761 [Martensiomyces pterosporus]|nr:hypothetical protein GQ54DRAFT_22761 [Martensiomyces pterosporus]